MNKFGRSTDITAYLIFFPSQFRKHKEMPRKLGQYLLYVNICSNAMQEPWIYVAPNSWMEGPKIGHACMT